MPKLKTIFDWGQIVQMIRSENYLSWTQERLARELGVSIFTVSKWECGQTEPQQRHREKLGALALNAGFDKKHWPRKDTKILRTVNHEGDRDK